MATDVFGRAPSTLKGVFAADLARVTLSNDITSVLMQSINFTYAQTVTRLYEIGTSNIYYTGGRTQGQMQVGRVVGPDTTVVAMYTAYGDICKAKGRSMTFDVMGATCASGQDVSYILDAVVLTSVGVNVTAQDMIIGEQCQLMFSSLSFNKGFKK